MVDQIHVEVAYAERDRQFLIAVELSIGATVADALVESAIDAKAGIDWKSLSVGIWSKIVAADTSLRDGDRVEIYRLLTIDPKTARRLRAEKSGPSKPHLRKSTKSQRVTGKPDQP